MLAAPVVVTPTEVRRLAIEVQRLGAERTAATAEAILELVWHIGCLQLESANPVAPSQRLVLASRLGPHSPRLLDRLLWHDRSLFEYFAHAASIVPSVDFAIHRLLMGSWARGDSAWDRRVRTWQEANGPLRESILRRIAAEGPLRSGEFELVAGPPWQSTAWPIARNVDRMLEFLWIEGRIVPAGRWRTQRIWDLTERWLPVEAAGPQPPDGVVTREAVQRSLRGLGVGTARHIDAHFTRYRYAGLPGVLRALAAEERIVPVAVRGKPGERPWPGEWWIHARDVPRLEAIRSAGEAWAGRTTLLSPFDNLIADRQRTGRLFSFDFRAELPMPKGRRRASSFVMPILHGDRLIGRVAPRFDRATGALTIEALQLEPNVPRTAAMARVVRGALDELAVFLGADRVTIEAAVPERWRRTMAG